MTPDAYAPVSASDPDQAPDPLPAPVPLPLTQQERGGAPRVDRHHLELPVTQAHDATGLDDEEALLFATPSIFPSDDAYVNEVTFGFLDGAAETPGRSMSEEVPRLRSAASPSRVTAHSELTARANPLQHLAGGSGSSARASGRNMIITTGLLVLLGVIPSTLIFLVDVSVHNLFSLRENLAVDSGPGSGLGLVLYIVSGVALCLVATFVCHTCSTHAEGSGIPQMKAIMSGFYDKMKPALSLWALLAKTVGLVGAIGGGLPVGWEGPNVHISCIVAHHLCRLPFFRSLRRDRALRMQIMACACAVGLASSFGTPIGGVLYALETTASFYLVPTFWKSIVATLAGSVVYDLLYKTPLVEAFENTSFEAGDYTRKQLVNFAAMGVLLGVIGAFFVRCVHAVYTLRKSRLPGTNRYVLLAFMGVLAALVQYPLRLFRLDPRSAINEFFSADNLETLSSLDVILLLLIKFPLIVVSIGLPVPAGVFIPCFLLGSGLGRLFGEALRIVVGEAIVPGGYAVVGAAAFTAGVTRALSCAVVMFEVTGQLHHMVPTLVAVTLSVVVANSINRSLYDTLIIMKELPYMPHMRRDRSPGQTVLEIMNPHVAFLYENTTLGEIREALDSNPGFESFPIVTPDMHVVGSVRRRRLIDMLSASPETTAHSDAKRLYEPSEELTARESAETAVVELSTGEGSGEFDADIVQCASESQADPGARPRVEDDPAANKHTTNGHAPVPQEKRNGTLDMENAAFDYGVRVPAQLIPDLSPLIVAGNTSLSQLHFMFVMLMPTHALVLSSGKLAGIVTRSDIVMTGASSALDTDS